MLKKKFVCRHELLLLLLFLSSFVVAVKIHGLAVISTKQVFVFFFFILFRRDCRGSRETDTVIWNGKMCGGLGEDGCGW